MLKYTPAQVGARSDVEYKAEVAPGASGSPATGNVSKPGLVETATGTQPGAGTEPGAGAKPSGGAQQPGTGQAPPKRSLWRALSSFTNKGGQGAAGGGTPNPKPGAQGEPGSAFAGGAGAPGTVALGSAAAPMDAPAPAPAPAQPKRQGLWGGFSKKSEQVRDRVPLPVLPRAAADCGQVSRQGRGAIASGEGWQVDWAGAWLCPPAPATWCSHTRAGDGVRSWGRTTRRSLLTWSSCAVRP